MILPVYGIETPSKLCAFPKHFMPLAINGDPEVSEQEGDEQNSHCKLQKYKASHQPFWLTTDRFAAPLEDGTFR